MPAADLPSLRVLISAGWLGGAGGAERALYSILRALDGDRVEVVVRERLHNYQKLQREARRDTLTALERKAQVQQWKARSRAGRARLESKRETPRG